MISVLFCSCGSGLQVKKSHVNYFDKKFSATVSNKSYKVKGKRYGDPTLLSLFEIRNENVDSVFIFFNNDNYLQINYTVNGQNIENTFNGAFSRKGYYEIYFRYQKKEIPPLLPVLYSNNNINRVRLALTSDGNLIVDNKWDISGNIFLLGAGSSGRRQSFFRGRK